jgi:hypothetical protein
MTLATTENRQIAATLGDNQEPHVYSCIENFNRDGRLWNRSNLRIAAMGRTVIQ